MWIGNSHLKVSRDSVFVVVRDFSVPIKLLEMGSDEIKKWGSDEYIQHIVKRIEAQGTMQSTEHSSDKYDSLFESASKN